jgi:hypothetical protein
MNKKHLLLILFSLVLALCHTACDDYLDIAPDNRAELDNPAKITSFLVSGYASHLFPIMTEMASDNIDHRTFPANLSYSYKNQEDMFYWGPSMDETGNDAPKDIWESFYGSIAVANQAIQAIEDLGSPEELNPQKGEALMIRAFHHFMLVNIFCLHYNETTSDTDMGLPFLSKPETQLNPHYERGTVAEFYQKIEQDIKEGLPLIDDALYTVAPKYHFNRRAAYALAARFYLYYGKYDEAIKCANEVLGEGTANLDKILRNLKIFPTLTADVQIYCREWINPLNNCTFLLMSATSTMGTVFSNYSTGKLYQHTRFIAENETVRSKGPWNPNGWVTNDWYHKSSLYTSSGYVTYPKLPYLFEYTDAIAGTGYTKSIYPAFTADELLLIRAEAYIVKQDYDRATADLAKWMETHFTTGVVLTKELINSYYGNLPYYKPEAPTPKKELHPLNFTIASQEQESYLHCMLHFRRIETLFYGLRWFDVKRFGIEIYRRDVAYSSTLDTYEKSTDFLKLDDPRRAIQLPSDVISAGLPANPRNSE